MEPKFYAGIGSRTTPWETLGFMTKIAQELSKLGYTLRSGGAEGADQAFESGATQKEILTWRDSTPEAEAIAETIHPAWFNCNANARAQHGRNVMQILGKDLKSPVELVICWTPMGAPIGGTRTAIMIASANKIPIYNLDEHSQIVRLRERFAPHL